MKNIIFSLLFISSITFAQTERFIGDFTKVTAFDKIDVTLIPSTENKVKLIGKNYNEVELVNKNGELKIRMPFAKMLSGETISATVYYTKLEAVEANEGSRISAKDAITAVNFDIICKEGSEIKLINLQADRLQVRVSQGSIVTVLGDVWKTKTNQRKENRWRNYRTSKIIVICFPFLVGRIFCKFVLY